MQDQERSLPCCIMPCCVLKDSTGAALSSPVTPKQGTWLSWRWDAISYSNHGLRGPRARTALPGRCSLFPFYHENTTQARLSPILPPLGFPHLVFRFTSHTWSLLVVFLKESLEIVNLCFQQSHPLLHAKMSNHSYFNSLLITNFIHILCSVPWFVTHSENCVKNHTIYF